MTFCFSKFFLGIRKNILSIHLVYLYFNYSKILTKNISKFYLKNIEKIWFFFRTCPKHLSQWTVQKKNGIKLQKSIKNNRNKNVSFQYFLDFLSLKILPRHRYIKISYQFTSSTRTSITKKFSQRTFQNFILKKWKKFNFFRTCPKHVSVLHYKFQLKFSQICLLKLKKIQSKPCKLKKKLL